MAKFVVSWSGDVEAFTLEDLDMMRDAVNSQRKYYIEDLRYALIRRKELLKMKQAQEKPLN